VTSVAPAPILRDHKEILVIQKAVALLALLWPLAAAHASITEIRKDFLNETSLLPATPIITAPAVNASYLICVTVGDVQTSAPATILRWTDENGEFRNFTYSTINGAPNGCHLIRNQADTAASIETRGTYSGFYNLFAFGFGFWPGQIQSQGGIEKPVNYAVTGTNGGHEFSFPGYPWLFSVVAASNCGWELSGGWSGAISGVGSQISTAYGGGNGVFTTLTADCGYTLIAVQFGGPALGPGALTDYELNLLNWTSATYPTWETVFTPSNAVNALVSWNIAEQPDGGLIEEAINFTGWGNVDNPCPTEYLADTAGDPASCVTLVSVAADAAFQVRTTNQTGQAWGTSPAYSAEVDVILF
jgi:hypothetical protein